MASFNLRKLASDEDGGATVELVLILPLFLLIVALIADASMLFFRQGEAYRVIQDANRNLSLGRFTSTDETSAFVTAMLAPMAPGATADSDIDNGIVTTTALMPISEIQITGLFPAFGSGNVRVTATHVIER